MKFLKNDVCPHPSSKRKSPNRPHVNPLDLQISTQHAAQKFVAVNLAY